MATSKIEVYAGVSVTTHNVTDTEGCKQCAFYYQCTRAFNDDAIDPEILMCRPSDRSDGRDVYFKLAQS